MNKIYIKRRNRLQDFNIIGIKKIVERKKTKRLNMTCVLSMPTLYTSPFNESGATVQNNGCDFNWINSSHTGLSDTQKNSTTCHIEASTGSSIPCRMEISNEVAESVKYGQLNGDFRVEYKVNSSDNDIEKDISLKGNSTFPFNLLITVVLNKFPTILFLRISSINIFFILF